MERQAVRWRACCSSCEVSGYNDDCFFCSGKLMQRVFVFPGQGSQSVGMLAELAGQDTVITETFAEGSAVLGYDLWQLVQQGPAELLSQTEHQQPAMLAAGVATWRYWLKQGGYTPDAVCGHSLGEFSALVASGALEFGAAVALVRERARYMQAAVPAGVGAIAAVIGLDDDGVTAACSEAAQGEVVELVNFNCPGQAVVAGHASAVQRALEACKRRGAKRAMLLPMSVPAHSSLMHPAATEFAVPLASVSLQVPRIAFWSPVDCLQQEDPEGLRRLLARQLVSPVRWTDLVRTLALAGASTFVECGPGKVLTGMNRRIEKRPEIQCLALQDVASVQAALAQSL
jgi:[acyl-carrier-protein] S-malonyltransferase